MSLFTGTASDDTAVASTGVLKGFSGSVAELQDNSADIFKAGGGNDVVSAGSQDDILQGDSGADSLDGGAGDDSIEGGSGIDSIRGGDGNDTFFMTAGLFIDDVDGGTGIDTLDLDPAMDGANVNLAAGSYSDGFMTRSITSVEIVLGTGGDDTIFGSSGSDTIRSNDGDDFINGGLGRDSINGGDGNDTIAVSDGSLIDNVDGGEGFDILDLSAITSRGANIDLAAGIWDLSPSFGGPATITSIELVIGTQANDFISAAGTTAFAFGSIFGEAGNDTIDIGIGSTVGGGSGNDTIIVREGQFPGSLHGDAGIDTLDLRDITSQRAIINTADGVMSLEPGGGSALDGIERVIGTARGDQMIGSAVDETFNGGKGGDRLAGGGGSDTLIGGRGHDVLTGGGGHDRFDFNAVNESGTTAQSRDVIRDFTHGADDIDLSTIDAREGVSGNQAFAFIGDDAFTAAGQIRAVKVGADTILQINTSGAGGAEMTIELANFNANTLSSADFIL